MLKKHEKLDVENLNEVISITKKLLKIGFPKNLKMYVRQSRIRKKEVIFYE